MNSQLYAHLEAYDSCNEGNEDDDKYTPLLSNLANPGDDDPNITAEVELCKSNQDKEEKAAFLLESAMIYVPVGVASLLSFLWNEELIAFLSIGTISFVWLVCWQQQQSAGRVSRQSQRKHSSQLMPVSRQQIEKESSIRHKFPSRSSIPSDIDNKKSEQDIYDCRNELSRLLGLIGAPPMAERNNSNNQQDGYRLKNIDNNADINDDHIFEKIDNAPAPAPTSVAAKDCVAAATTSVVSFLEAHVQVILTIDKALYWVKISASLHWGLGPHSQCVERVERAAMSKELFRARHRSADRQDDRTNEKNCIPTELPTSASSVRVRQARMDQPQKEIDSSSILALSSARRNIAHVIVNEARSIVNTLRIVDDCVIRQRRRLLNRFPHQVVDDNGEEANDNEYNNYRTDNNVCHTGVGEYEHDHERVVKNSLLEIPDVIDIAWIKASRKYLANLLSYSVEHFSTWESLRILSSLGDNKHEASSSPPTQPLRTLNESMWNARNLREYLMCHLLLDDDKSSISSVSRLRSVSPIIRSGGVDNEYKFILPLLQFQKQLNALDAALWSFQQYIYNQRVDSTTSSVSGARATKKKDNTSQQQEDHYRHNEENQAIALRSSSAKLTWWNQFKEISATCQTLEQEIENRLFSPSEHGIEGNHDSSDECSVPLGSSSNSACEAQSYEHIEAEKSPNYEQRKKPSLITTKTLVFSGEGSKEKGSTNKMKQKSMADDDSGTRKLQSERRSTAMPLPSARDTFTEQLLLRELQNRIRSVAALREEEQQVGLSRVEFQETCGEDEHQSSQEAMTADENTADAIDAFRNESILNGNTTRVESSERVGRKREITTNIFLGASGSLLDELKRNICPDQIIDNPKEIMNTDEVGDGYVHDTFVT